MYSDRDLDEAVSAGALTTEDVARFRAYIERRNAAPLADEESFRLVTSFNDIFVSVAIIALLVFCGWAAGLLGLGGIGVAAVSWWLAEYFTRRRRMALPSILLLVAFVGGIFTGLANILELFVGALAGSSTTAAGHTYVVGGIADDIAAALGAGVAVAIFLGMGLLTGLATLFHWRRFHVPITIAAAAAVAVVTALVAAGLLGFDKNLILVFSALLGISVLGLAMRYDASDRSRRTRRADVAFWLHLLAAPLIIHPLFTLMGVFSSDISAGESLLILAIYLVLAYIALVIDRRAALVSGLGYVLYAIGTMYGQVGGFADAAPLAAGTIGSALLLLSIFWQRARAMALKPLPEPWARRVPEAGSVSRSG